MSKFMKWTITVVVIIIILSAFWSFYLNFNDAVYTVTVLEKERVTDSSDSKYLIFCEDKYGTPRVFENTDTFIRGKFNSSDVYGSLKEGNTYKLTVVGARVPIFNMYENIIAVSEVKSTKK